MLENSRSSLPQIGSIVKRTLFILLLFLLGLFGVLQTQWFIKHFLHRPDHKVLNSHIEECNKRQKEIYDRLEQQSGKPPGENIYIMKDHFSQTQHDMIAEATKSLVDDDDTVPYFRTSLKEVRAVIFPAWMVVKREGYEDFGITPEGARNAPVIAGKRGVDALTLRDRHDLPYQVTNDGRPRIAINLSAFGSSETLRLTIFHELLHAGNVPGYVPGWREYLQNDLKYLPEYRSYIAREGLEGWQEWKLWVWWVWTPWGVGILIILFTPWRDRLNGRKVIEPHPVNAGPPPAQSGRGQGVAPLPGEVAPMSPDAPPVSDKQHDGGD
jgi:hypothetical protein